MRCHQHLITNDVVRYMAEYEVCIKGRAFARVSNKQEAQPTLAGQRGPRRDRPTRAVVGGVVFCMGSGWRVRIPVAVRTLLPPSIRRNPSPSRLGHTISSAYIVHFHTHLFSVLPATFAGGFKKLLAATLGFFTEGAAPSIPASVQDSKLWPAFELLGLADRYESLIASVCYEHIEAHVLEMAAGKWDEPVLVRLREWMADKVVPWMLLPYARGAKTS